MRHLDARLNASTGSPIAWRSSRIKNSNASTGRPRHHNIWTLTSIWRRKKKARFFLPLQSHSGKEWMRDCQQYSNRLLREDEIEAIERKFSYFEEMFMTSSMHAAIFLGKDSSENLHSVRNTDRKPTVQKLFDVTQGVIREQKLEISGVSELSRGTYRIGRSCLSWTTRRRLSSWWRKSICSQTLYCVSETWLNTHNQTLNGKIDYSGSKSTQQYRERIGWNRWGTRGVRMDRIFSGHTTLQILQEIQALMRELN